MRSDPEKRPPSLEQAGALMRKLDKAGDDMLSETEFAAYMMVCRRNPVLCAKVDAVFYRFGLDKKIA